MKQKITNAGSTRASPRASKWCTAFIIAAALTVLSGCAVGPDFKKPAAPAVSWYTASPLPAVVSGGNIAGGRPQRFVPGGDISGDWW
ncbi:MAG: hypothetical protein KGJ78_18970, partial [Alphaproteobacteria bacterium]|nr:hypothetical protein [Alphaproteobacteria bacterium]